MTNDNSEGHEKAVAAAPDGRWLTPGVAAVGAASFFSDTGHEVTTSVLPTFLTGTLGASAAALGVIDGISDALIGVMKLVGGPSGQRSSPAWADRVGWLSRHRVGDGSDRRCGHGVAGRRATCHCLAVEGVAVAGA